MKKGKKSYHLSMGHLDDSILTLIFIKQPHRSHLYNDFKLVQFLQIDSLYLETSRLL